MQTSCIRKAYNEIALDATRKHTFSFPYIQWGVVHAYFVQHALACLWNHPFGMWASYNVFYKRNSRLSGLEPHYDQDAHCLVLWPKREIKNMGSSIGQEPQSRSCDDRRLISFRLPPACEAGRFTSFLRFRILRTVERESSKVPCNVGSMSKPPGPKVSKSGNREAIISGTG